MSHAAGGWTRIAAPRFSAGGAALTAYGVRADAPDEVYATNGTAVARSLDGGCVWSEILVLGAVPSADLLLSGATASVMSVYAPAGTTALYLVAGDGARLQVLRSADDGATWQSSQVGGLRADVVTSGGTLLAGSTDGARLYLVTAAGPVTAAATGRLVYTSTDGGATWTASDIPARLAAAGAGRVLDLSTDPGSPNVLYAATDIGVFRSADGTAWTNTGVGGGSAFERVTAGRVAGRGTAMGIDNVNHVAYGSTDGGNTWVAVTLPDAVTSAAMSPVQGSGIVTTSGGVYQVRLSPPGISQLGTNTPALTDARVAAARVAYAYGCECGSATSAIWRRVDPLLAGGLSFAGDPPVVVPPGLGSETHGCSGSIDDPGDPREPAPSTLTPASRTVTVIPGRTKTVKVRFDAAPRELDVYYLGASGSRMEFALCPFVSGVAYASRQVAQVRNLRVGLGEFRDYAGQTDDWSAGIPRPSFVYLRRASIGASGAALRTQLAGMTWVLGQPDRAAAEALVQAATGAGQDLAPAGPSPTDIAGGLQAGFRAPAYKVALIVTGSFYNDAKRNPGYPGVGADAAIAALRAGGIHQVGVWVNNVGNKQGGAQQFDGRADMQHVARETGTLSPSKLDCNGDAFTDFRAGDPLVCDWISATGANWTATGDVSMGTEMERLLLALRDPETLKVVPVAGATNVGGVSPPAYPGVDVLQRSARDYDVTFQCDPKEANTVRPVTLAGLAGNLSLATAVVDVRCGLPVAPAARMWPPPMLVPPPPVPAAPAQPVTGPAQMPAAQPAPQPAPNPAQMPQAQGQAVTHAVPVPERQVEPQLAFQRATTELQTNEMSALPEPARDPLGAARRLALLGGACLTAAAAVVRARTAVARGRQDRR